ncbi:hypothetical protein [Yoonia maricola]|nr:hypothetical protein [Yoonia maricola]
MALVSVEHHKKVNQAGPKECRKVNANAFNKHENKTDQPITMD